MHLDDIAQSLRYKFCLKARAVADTPRAVNAFIGNLLDGNHGIAFGEIHGIYAFPLYLAERMEAFAQKNVTRLYVEMIPHTQKDALDLWQDAQDPKPLIDFMNGRSHVNATDQWKHYWIMFQAAKAAGIRVVAVDKRPNMDEPQSTNFNRRNDFWMDRIIEDRETLNSDDKIIVYGGRDHFRNLGGKLGIASRMAIPAFLMETGPRAVALLSERNREYLLTLPRVPHQIAHFNGHDVKHHKIPYPD